MADNFLERHYVEYEQRKADYIRRKRHLPKMPHRPERPDDEAL
jgi:hypothetical protein